MKFSEAWLREWVQTDLTSEQLCETLTMAGLEVDEVLPVAESFSGVVVGRVLSCIQHPDADKLRVTKVDVGASESLDIVCGASNCREGIRVAVAQVGAVLPRDFKIKKAKLRGQPSHGMLCAYQELGIDIEAEGILELPADAPIGMDFRDYLNLNDQIIDIDLTPNRADCLSIQGVARDVAALTGSSYEVPATPSVVVTEPQQLSIELQAPKACPKYLGRVIQGVNLSAQAPLWMQEKLRRSGIRSIDPIVDVTNFVMLELGQPMHAFDLASIQQGIKVRFAEQGETLTLLDGKTVTLQPETLVVADAHAPLALAGIFGGEASSVTSTTQDIFLECAFFAPDVIRGQARVYGLHTDSSHRFERGVDFELQEKAMARATALIVEICGGRVAELTTKLHADAMPTSQAVTLRKSKLDQVLGHVISHEEVHQILNHLELQAHYDNDTWKVQAPSFRFDMKIEEDLIEEVARVYGYHRIPHQAPTAELTMRQHQESALSLKKVRQTLLARGYQEAITYSFVDPKLQKLLHPEQTGLKLPHPISEDMSEMRMSQLTGLLNVVSHNQKRQQHRVRLFETGLRFVPDAKAPMGVHQEQVITMACSGANVLDMWHTEAKAASFFDLKADLESMLQMTADSLSFEFQAAPVAGFHPGQCAKIMRYGQQVGVIGTLHPNLQKPFGLSDRVVLCEMTLASVLEARVPEFAAISKYPSNRRDIAVVVEEKVQANDLLKVIRKIGADQLVDLNLFDIYQGSGIEQGFKSFALSMVIQNIHRTLEEPEITEIVAEIVQALQTEFNASLRD
jgi:phenylalanyl-tRNA synthetase beta chain